MNALFHAHSGLRYLIILVALVAVVVMTKGLISNKPVKRAASLSVTFTILVDLQFMLGLGLFLGGISYDALFGHMMLMLAAAVVANAALVLASQRRTARSTLIIRLSGIVFTMLLIVVGIMAIGRPVFGSAAMTIMQ